MYLGWGGLCRAASLGFGSRNNCFAQGRGLMCGRGSRRGSFFVLGGLSLEARQRRVAYGQVARGFGRL